MHSTTIKETAAFHQNSHTMINNYVQMQRTGKCFSCIRCVGFALFALLLLGCFCYPAEACSSRTVPKPRPSMSSSTSGIVLPSTQPPIMTTTTLRTTTTTTARPNITFATYKCPEAYDTYYCLNEGHCFAVRFKEQLDYSCECPSGFMGQRCDYKEIDGSYLPKRPSPMLEKASIASGAMCALVLMLIVCLALYLRFEQRTAKKAYELEQQSDEENSEQCECCRAQCCSDADEAPPKLPYYMRLEHTLLSFTLRRSTKL